MNRVQPPWPNPNPPPPTGCATLLLVLVGVIMLLPGLCAIIGLLPTSGAAPMFWGFLVIGGVFLIWYAVNRPRDR